HAHLDRPSFSGIEEPHGQRIEEFVRNHDAVLGRLWRFGAPLHARVVARLVRFNGYITKRIPEAVVATLSPIEHRAGERTVPGARFDDDELARLAESHPRFAAPPRNR